LLFWSKLLLHVAPQFIPSGFEVTVPDPVFDTVSWTADMNSALTDFAKFIDTVQLPVPVQAPVQPLNTLPAPAVAVSVTDVPQLNVSLQSEPQLIPVPVTVLVDAPDPDLVTVNEYEARENVAETDLSVSNPRVQLGFEPDPAQAPPHVTFWHVPGAALSVTVDSTGKYAEQVVPQFIPDGFEVTVPVPDFETKTRHVAPPAPEHSVGSPIGGATAAAAEITSSNPAKASTTSKPFTASIAFLFSVSLFKPFIPIRYYSAAQSTLSLLLSAPLYLHHRRLFRRSHDRSHRKLLLSASLQ
jgi:hypothetical protein